MKKMLWFSVFVLGAGLFLHQLRYKIAAHQHIEPLPVYTNLLLTAL